MFKAEWSNKEFTITGVPTISDSSRESKFSDLQVDFTGFEEEDLPIQYEEVKIFRNGELFSVGYVDIIEFPEFTSLGQPFLIDISLISPYGYSSKRTLSIAINTEPLEDCIEDILQPLINDGFEIEFKQLADREVSEIFRGETIEKIMNYMARKYGFVWYIDKQKKIYLYDINFLRARPTVLHINNNNHDNLKSIRPYKTVVDYANQLILKDFFLITKSTLINEGTILRPGEEYTFRYPFSISENVRRRVPITVTNSLFYIRSENDIWSWFLEDAQPSPNVGFAGEDDDDPTKTLLLITENNDSTKVIGFKYNGAEQDTIFDTFDFTEPNVSYTSLIPYIFRITDPAEISRTAGKANTSGLIEKPVKLNGRYLTASEVDDLAESLFVQNNVATNEVDLKFKGLIDEMEELVDKLNVTNRITVNLPQFKVNDNFVIVDVFKIFGRETIEIEVVARNYNLNENFNDIFRLPDEQLSTDDLINEMSAFYFTGENFVIRKDVLVDEEVITDE